MLDTRLPSHRLIEIRNISTVLLQRPHNSCTTGISHPWRATIHNGQIYRTSHSGFAHNTVHIWTTKLYRGVCLCPIEKLQPGLDVIRTTICLRAIEDRSNLQITGTEGVIIVIAVRELGRKIPSNVIGPIIASEDAYFFCWPGFGTTARIAGIKANKKMPTFSANTLEASKSTAIVLTKMKTKLSHLDLR